MEKLDLDYSMSHFMFERTTFNGLFVAMPVDWSVETGMIEMGLCLRSTVDGRGEDGVDESMREMVGMDGMEER